MISVTLPDGSVKQIPRGASAADVAAKIGRGLAKAALAAKADYGNGDVTLDLATPLAGDCRLTILTNKDEETLTILRHSTAHVMAEAICKLWPETKLVYGPPVEGGYYYDIDLDHRLLPDDFPRIEEEMTKIVRENRPFTRYEMSREEGMKKVRREGNPYKVENAERAKGEVLSFYVTGSKPGADWEDLCMGTHIPATGRIGAFKILSVSGAFLHGDANKKQLQRVNGTAFHAPKDLQAYLKRMEEARKRDHRRIGQELGLFTLDPLVGSGLVLWKPNGAIVRNLLENYLRRELVRHGYQPVYSPNIGRLELYRTSGHYPHYEESQFPVMFFLQDGAHPLIRYLRDCRDNKHQPDPDKERELLRATRILESEYPWDESNICKKFALVRALAMAGMEDCTWDEMADRYAKHREQGYLLKPMNCPHHIRIYASEPRSYRDLPVRLAEFGTVYRYEQSGELSGLTRVRGFTQDDAHLFCTPDQLQEELAACLQLTRYVLDGLGLDDYRVRIGLRDPDDPKYIDDPQAWSHAEEAIRQAVAASGLTAREETGEAAFYGPKIDFIVKDCIGREWQLGTVQVDYNLPNRFNLEYTGRDNRAHQPIMIHRAPFGSLERFTGILIEHYEGAFPFWLSPLQVIVTTISEKSSDYAKQLTQMLQNAGLRVELDESPERIGPKKHRARKMKIPYIAVIGEQEAAQGTVNVNDRDGRQLSDMTANDFLAMLLQENNF